MPRPQPTLRAKLGPLPSPHPCLKLCRASKLPDSLHQLTPAANHYREIRAAMRALRVSREQRRRCAHEEPHYASVPLKKG
ncbi:MAG: hypothetical protein HY270_17885 [Deltaproteobacteria bacterium]|nr:hypothetical protein [Deltaproteobacteria bacterium]